MSHAADWQREFGVGSHCNLLLRGLLVALFSFALSVCSLLPALSFPPLWRRHWQQSRSLRSKGLRPRPVAGLPMRGMPSKAKQGPKGKWGFLSCCGRFPPMGSLKNFDSSLQATLDLCTRRCRWVD